MTELATWATAHARTVGGGLPSATVDRWARLTAPLAFRETRAVGGPAARMRAVAVRLGPDGRRVLASSSDRAAHLRDLDGGRDLATLAGHGDTVGAVAWAPYDALLATASADATVRIWDHAGQCLRVITHGDEVNGIAWSPRSDEPQLATTAWDGRIRIWSVGGLHERGVEERGLDMASIPNTVGWLGGVRVAVGDDDGGAWIWDPDTTEPHRLGAHSAAVTALATDGGHRFATAARDGSVRIWDAGSMGCERELDGHGATVWGMAWADGLLATASGDGTARIWDPGTGTVLAELRHPDEVNAVAFADGGASLQVVTACDDGHARLWTADVPTAPGESRPAGLVEFRPQHVLTGHTNAAVRAALTEGSDGRLLLATASADHTVRIWDADAGRSELTLAGHDGEVVDVGWSRDGHGRPGLRSVTLRGELLTWDLATGERATGLDIGPQWSIALLRHPDGRELLAGSGDGIDAQVWDLGSGERVRAMRDRDGAGRHAYAVAVAWTVQDGRSLLAVGDAAGASRVWDADSGDLLVTLSGHSGPVTSLGWARSAGGSLLLVTGSVDGTARVGHAGSGALLHTLAGHTDQVRSLSCSSVPGGPVLAATASADGTVRVWDVEEGASVATLRHPDVVSGAALWAGRPGRLVLAACCADATVHVWEADVGSPADRTDPVTHWERRPTAVAEVVLLGAHGAWHPLGLTSDLVALTGPAGATRLFDPRLRGLADHPGIARLRTLGWPPDARATFAALLGATQPGHERFRPPDSSSPSGQRTALATAVASTQGPPEAVVGDVGALVDAADRVTAGTVTLLRVIGPRAAAADPLLAVRLAHRVPELPALTAPQSELLAAVSNGARLSRRSSGGSTVRAAGTAGVTRRGSPTSLLLTQLALPDDVFDARYAANELLYRHHPAGNRPRVEPVTIVLDTTPPTFGPAECALRLVAHLIIRMLWRSGMRPSLVTLTEPGRVHAPTQPADLLEVWTSRTLDPPDLAAAWRTAGDASGNPLVTLTMHHQAPSNPGPLRRLVTTHQPGRPPRHQALGRHHQHLPPEPSDAELAVVLTAVLAPEVRR